MPYSPLLVKPFRDELVVASVKELNTAADVDSFMADKKGVAMVVFNSVCGCAAGTARPAVNLALKNAKKPARVASVFAGQDLEATARMRSIIADVPLPLLPLPFLKMENWFILFPNTESKAEMLTVSHRTLSRYLKKIVRSIAIRDRSYLYLSQIAFYHIICYYIITMQSSQLLRSLRNNYSLSAITIQSPQYTF